MSNGNRPVVDGTQIAKAIEVINTAGMMAPRVDLRPELFDTAIQQQGYRMIWEQAMYCSCYDRTSGQPDMVCGSCYGKGYKYINPQEIRALATSISANKDLDRVGLNEMGTAYLTAPSTCNIGYRDRFTIVDFTTRFSEILEYTGNDRLRYPATEIVAVYQLNQEYRRGVHFNLSEDKMYLEWITKDLELDTRYSVLYDLTPVYIAMGPIHDLRGTYTLKGMKGMEGFMQLPKQFQIKREDFLANGE